MNAEHYRRKALHYLTCAHEMMNPNARAALIELAAHWQQMAQANERLVPQNEHIVQGQYGE
jgi:TPR repeat protein